MTSLAQDPPQENLQETTPSLETSKRKSALQENLDNKGKNSYYFAHTNTPTGPQWDGKQQPRLLSKQSSSQPCSFQSFDYGKSNITSYAFCDVGSKIKLYLDLPDVGIQCSTDDITLDYTEQTLCLAIQNYNPDKNCLAFGKLSGLIDSATFTLKPHKIIVTLVKLNPEVEWNTINDKGET